ncbi:MAG: hypothetical protein M3033_12110 [Acidobacteriota bacterium]|nr:hypothetical protein [Acidobacteriota bacterium]
MTRESGKQLEKKHSLATRWLHWISFPLLTMMIWSGILIYWANAAYSVKIFGYGLFHFFPSWFYETLGIPFRLAEGISLHFFFMWFFTVNGIIYVLYTIISGGRKISTLPIGGFASAAWQIKRIGRIEFTEERPRDFWAEQGYDWYSGH